LASISAPTLVSPELFAKLIGHTVEDACKYFSATGAKPLREDTRRRFPFAGIVFEEDNAAVTLATGATETLVPAGEGIAFRHLRCSGQPDRARQLARPDGSAIEIKTEASILPVNKRARLAVKIRSSN